MEYVFCFIYIIIIYNTNWHSKVADKRKFNVYFFCIAKFVHECYSGIVWYILLYLPCNMQYIYEDSQKINQTSNRAILVDFLRIFVFLYSCYMLTAREAST